MFKKKCVLFLLLSILGFSCLSAYSQDIKFPNYSDEFLGQDKWENINRKIFNFNQCLNKYAIRPIHVIWSSLVPKYGIDRINGVTNNIEYPIRLVSSLIQRDFQTSKNESIRFLTNTILGLGGMFDPAKRFLNIEQSQENMEQALAHCKCKSGPFFVAPVIYFTTVRGLFGKLLDMAFNPTSYIGSPILAAVKAGLTINRTSYLQPLLYMVESTFADPYDIIKKAFGINNYINLSNMDRVDVKPSLYINVKDEPGTYQITSAQNIQPPKPKEQKKKSWFKKDVEAEIVPDTFYIDIDEILANDNDNILKADIKLPKFNPQSPVVDSMRTALFSIPSVDKSLWNELSIWNRSFSSRIKTASINLTDGRDNYKYRYILQHNKNKHNLAVIYPSIGEGIMSTHSILLAKLFYDAGYSVIIQGSHFQWEFVKSMPENYYPGLPEKDADFLRKTTSKIISHLEKKYNYKFENKVILGTSLGALASLFVASKEAEENLLGNTTYISICPPPNLIFALKQVDKNTGDWKKLSDDLKQKTALAASKAVKLYQSKEDIDFEINNLPFNEEEGKLITGFIMHQKLSDLIYTIENHNNLEKNEIYNKINNMGYQDYAEKYLMSEEDKTLDDLEYKTSLNSISDYLKNAENYKIYHSLNDYLTNTEQLKKLKQDTGKNTILVDNGSHLGFLYRQEFINHLKNTISLN